MTIREVEAKSILRRHKKIDSWFVSRVGMNLYRGCMHDCVYCDGRAEKYQVSGDFGREVEVKINALEILRREISPKGKRKPFPGGFVMIGGGVSDGYQPVERRYRLSRSVLQLMAEAGRPVHLLTKSTLVREDLEIIKAINEKSRAIVSFSFSSVDDELSAKLEPGVPVPSERLETMKLFKQNGLATGMFLMPVIPNITDSVEQMQQSLARATEYGIDFVIYGGLTLKDGRQKDVFYEFLKKEYPQHLDHYQQLYKGDQWGAATDNYYHLLHQRFRQAARPFDLPLRMPLALFVDLVDINERIIIMLEQMDYLSRLYGRSSFYGKAAWALSAVQEPVSAYLAAHPYIKYINPATRELIAEILCTGASVEYERLIHAGRYETS
jgi:DNA repair photolyase